ncbi:methyl-accepting chemotaxis protein [Granulicella sp. L60]|jgi:methyl-accepting chemotaxis protein|uniref:methyl-accepting chemotaxis protein n=1 Tax=Granulicella sp. L60 TaxID=1641866 RepID=UPI00131D2558|nr:methyl-accepting chemotaxis protein [Granulicella sp. L60]
MQLQSKMLLITGAMIGTIVLSAGIAHRYIEQANVLSTRVTEDRIPIIMTTRDIRSHFTETIRSLESYMLFGINPATSIAYRNARREQFDQAVASLADLRKDSTRVDLGADAERINSLESNLTALKGLEEQVETLNESKSSDGTAHAYDMLQNQILPLEKSLFDTTSQLTASQTRMADEEQAELRRATHSSIVVLWLGTILASLIGGTMALYLARKITHALDMVMNRAHAIASGDLSGEPLVLHTTDQTGTLAHAVQQMQNSLAEIIGTVAGTAGTLSGSVGSMSSASDQIHRRMDQQSQQTQQAATAMQEMSASIAEVSRHTQSAAETARGAAETAREGGTIVKQVLGSMHSIATAVSDTSTTVGLLGEDSRKISQIVTVIDEIARKTNLLALNAAIEAARAGDQGRGFAVVAGEVRRLAESTAQATGEIASMIQGIQDRTLTAIASMESGTGTVQQGVITTNQAGEALERIIGMAERVDRMITQIAIATSQQTVAADQSSASLDAIHTLSHENLSGMATTATGIEALRATAVSLEQHVDRFNLRAAPDSRLVRTSGGAERLTVLQPA